MAAIQQKPCSLIEPVIDGEISSYFEWLGAGLYRPDLRHGTMHGGIQRLTELRYGSDGERLFLRLDVDQSSPRAMAGSEVRLLLKTSRGETELRFALTSDGAALATATRSGKRHPAPHVECGYLNIFELSAELKGLGALPGEHLALQLSLWRDGLPLEAIPVQGWLDFIPADWEE